MGALALVDRLVALGREPAADGYAEPKRNAECIR